MTNLDAESQLTFTKNNLAVKKRQLPYNPFFVIPFFAWIVAGGIALATFTKPELFFAVNSHYSDTANVFMYYMTRFGQAEVIAPILFLLMLVPRFRNIRYLYNVFACNLIPFIAQQLLKMWFNAPRPLLVFSTYNPTSHTVHYLSVWPKLLHSSFPSGHSEGASSFFCFLSLLLPDKYRIYGFVFFLCAMLVCYSRLYLAAHFFSDVYAGSIIGATLTNVIFILISRTKQSLTTYTTQG